MDGTKRKSVELLALEAGLDKTEDMLSRVHKSYVDVLCTVQLLRGKIVELKLREGIPLVDAIG